MINWIRAGQELNLDDRENGFYLLATDNFGMPAFHRLEERGAMQHGVTDRGYRLDPRFITLVVGIQGNSVDDFYQKRETLLEAFAPSNTAGSLRWQRGSVTRQIDGYLIEGLQFTDSDRTYLFQKVPITIKCPDPTWYDPGGKSVDFGIGGGENSLVIPLVIPTYVGSSTINLSQQIMYNGTVATYPVITIRGPITNCVITNTITGKKLDFTGHTIAAGTVYTIDLRYGHKTITDQNGDSQISKLTNDSDLATWRLLPDPNVAGGVNSIQATGAGATSATAINVQYFERFIGV